MNDFARTTARADQADGLRRLFAGHRQRLVPLVANPHVDSSAVLLERLSSAFAERGARLLVVDAADTSPDPDELIDMDLASCIEPLGGMVHYLAARGLPLRHVNARGSSEAWMAAVETAAPRADVIVVHANARDLVRLLGRRDVRPVLMCGADGASLTDAYASMKLLSQRARLMSYDLLVAADGRQRHALDIAERLAHTGDHFLGTVVRGHAVLDGQRGVEAPLPAELHALALGQLGSSAEPFHDFHGAASPAWSAPTQGAPVELSALLY